MSRLQIRRVDPTLDMEADQGDDYTHLPVCCLIPFFILYYFKDSVFDPGSSSILTGHIHLLYLHLVDTLGNLNKSMNLNGGILSIGFPLTVVFLFSVLFSLKTVV